MIPINVILPGGRSLVGIFLGRWRGGWALAALFAATASARAEPKVDARPNILFCIADDASYEHFSANGSSWVRTPAFDRIAREGVRFTQAYTPNAKCAPSRACILTGRNSWQLEAAANHNPFFPAKFTTIFELLGQRGYAIGFTGKGYAPGNPGMRNGAVRELTGKAYNRITLNPPSTGIFNVDYAANFERFLEERTEAQPFCFWFGAREPHRAYEYGSGTRLTGRSEAEIDEVPQIWPGDSVVRTDLLDYAGEVEYFDHQLARFLDILERRGLAENTIVIVTSDNGMPFPRVKGASYVQSHRMPLVIRWPGVITKPGRAVDAYVSFIDLAPTFIDASGEDPAKETGMAPMQGRTLRPLLAGESFDKREWDHVLLGQERHDVGRPGDVGYPVRGMVNEHYLYLRNFEPTRWPMGDPITGYANSDGGPTKTRVLDENRAGINHWRWALDFGRRPPEELYALADDPWCVANLAGQADQRERIERMREELFRELRRQGDPRMAGQGDVFDEYPFANPDVRGLYDRMVRDGEKVFMGWIEESDIESPGFDPEAPLAVDPPQL